MQNKSKVILLPCSSYREELPYEELKKKRSGTSGRSGETDKKRRESSSEAESSEKSGSGKSRDHASGDSWNVCASY